MENLGIGGLLLLLLTVFVSYKGFNNPAFFDQHKFQVGRILGLKEYQRLVTSAFLHGSWTHLLFNMASLYFFSGIVNLYVGPFNFLLIYLASLLGGSLLALYINRNNSSYSAIGASGAVCGIIFAAIALDPSREIGLLLIPYYIPGWLFGFAYILISIWGIKNKTSNIGHEAHLGGAITGMLSAIIMVPEALRMHYISILLILLPAVAFLIYLIKNPSFIVTGQIFERAYPYQTIEDRYNAEKRRKERELDLLLDKISERGIESLSKKEKKILEQHAATKD